MTSYSAQIFFFDQKIILKRKKRRRKHPDELPRSLRFANLNPRLAAFLSSQERQKNKKAQEGDGGDDGQDGQDGNAADGFTKHLRRRGSLDSLEDGDYSQRQMYHEAVVAAPTLLVQLSKILYLFEKEHLDLSRELVNDLQSSYKGLTSEVQYTKYEWQCPENVPKDDQKEMEGGVKKRDGDQEEVNGEGDKGEKKKRKKKKAGDGDEELKGSQSAMDSTIGSAMSSYRDMQGTSSSVMQSSQRVRPKTEKSRGQLKVESGKKFTQFCNLFCLLSETFFHPISQL